MAGGAIVGIEKDVKSGATFGDISLGSDFTITGGGGARPGSNLGGGLTLAGIAPIAAVALGAAALFLVMRR